VIEFRVRLALATIAVLAAGSFFLTQCRGQGLSGGDGSESDATAEDGTVGDELSPTCGPIGSVCFGDAGGPACAIDRDWGCAVDTRCGTPTTLTGKVFDPAGVNPLANAVVFVPNSIVQLPPISQGGPTCGLLTVGNSVTVAVTDSTGSFTLSGVPVGSDVPVTVQMGKWRRTVNVSISKDCSANPVPDGTLHLPGRRADGDMPAMALLTGGGDDLACFLVSAGIDPSEFSAPGGEGRVAVYRGVGGADLSNGTPGDCTGAQCPLWGSTTSLDAYDVLLLGCEGGENLQTKPAAARQAMHDWLTAGGKLFGVHYEDTWFANGAADFQGVANWIDAPEAGASGPFRIDPTVAQGISFRQWAVATGIGDADGGLPLLAQDVATSVSSVNARTTAWIHDESTAELTDGSTFAGNVKAFTIGIPTGLADSGVVPTRDQCGRAVFSDIHPGGTAPRSPIPSACAGLSMTPEEKALEFLFFSDFAVLSNGCELCPPGIPLVADGGSMDDGRLTDD